jgi:NAD(P)-dependent dehydrogenase (short-subunit alcohol dehydrogenase family)
VELVQPGSLLVGKHVLVTGGGRNIGRAIARECAAQGAYVYSLDKDAETAHRTAEQVQGTPIVADITDDPHAWLQQLPVVDVLVNNVGVAAHDDTDPWHTVFETNVFAPMRLTTAVTDRMRVRGSGTVIFISSIHQEVPRGDPPYAASKAAVAAIVSELALELISSGIRVNAVAPGWTKADPSGVAVPDRRQVLQGVSVPPEYIGRAVVYLASDYFSLHTTGSIVTVDSGLSLLTESRRGF